MVHYLRCYGNDTKKHVPTTFQVNVTSLSPILQERVQTKMITSLIKEHKIHLDMPLFARKLNLNFTYYPCSQIFIQYSYYISN